MSTHVSAIRNRTGGSVIWKIEGKTLKELINIPETTIASFTPDGTGFAAFKSRSMEVFDLATAKRRQLINLEKSSNDYGGPFDGLLISDDGLVAASFNSGAVWNMRWSADDIGDHLRAILPRCLTLKEREDVHLGAEPPDWCIELSKWPFDGPEWKRWLEVKKAGKNAPAPQLPASSAPDQTP